MANDSRLTIVKNLILEERLPAFRDIFLYVPKTGLAKSLGINYTRFLKLTKDPRRFRYGEIILLARIIGVPALSLSKLIHNQIEGKKK